MAESKYKLIQSLQRAFSIIDCFDEGNEELSLNQISKQTGINISTVRGLVHTLVHNNYLAYNKAKNVYRLGMKFIEKANLANFSQSEQVISIVESDLQSLANVANISVRLLSIEGLSVSNIYEVNPNHSRYMLNIRENADFPFFASATGKLLYAFVKHDMRQEDIEQITWQKHAKNTIQDQEGLNQEINNILQQGYSYENQELSDGFSSLAVPILKDQEMIYSVSATGPYELIANHFRLILERLFNIQQMIEELLSEY